MRIWCAPLLAAVRVCSVVALMLGCGPSVEGAATSFPALASGESVADGARADLADPDHDAIPNRDDRCPNEPEDYDGFEDDDGCPDVDSDSHHVIVDSVDRCMWISGCADGFFVDEDGCPDVEVLFAPRVATLDAAAFSLLDAIADELIHDAVVALLRITGTSTAAEPPIAVQRAAAVRNGLMARGVPASMLMVAGTTIAEGMPTTVTFDAISCDPR